MAIKYEVEKITPEKALSYLRKTQGNRNFKTDQVMTFAAHMKRGEWVVNNDCITFDTTGTLVDGHHRLLAVIAANMTVEMGVLRGVEPKARDTINSGTSRTFADRLKFHGVQNSTQRAAFLTSAVRIVVGANVSLKSIDDMHTWEPPFKKAIDTYFSLGCAGSNVRHMRSAKAAGPLIVAFKADPVRMTEFYGSLRDGANLRANAPALKLREFLITDSQGESRFKTAPDLTTKVFAACKAYLDNREITKLQPSDTAVSYFRALYSRGNISKLSSDARDMRNVVRRAAGLFDLTPGKPKVTSGTVDDVLKEIGVTNTGDPEDPNK